MWSLCQCAFKFGYRKFTCWSFCILSWCDLPGGAFGMATTNSLHWDCSWVEQSISQVSMLINCWQDASGCEIRWCKDWKGLTWRIQLQFIFGSQVNFHLFQIHRRWFQKHLGVCHQRWAYSWLHCQPYWWYHNKPVWSQQISVYTININKYNEPPSTQHYLNRLLSTRFRQIQTSSDHIWVYMSSPEPETKPRG